MVWDIENFWRARLSTSFYGSENSWSFFELNKIACCHRKILLNLPFPPNHSKNEENWEVLINYRIEFEEMYHDKSLLAGMNVIYNFYFQISKSQLFTKKSITSKRLLQKIKTYIKLYWKLYYNKKIKSKFKLNYSKNYIRNYIISKNKSEIYI